MATNKDINIEDYERYINVSEFENFKRFLKGFNELRNVEGKSKQTCLEKRGIEKRDELTAINFNNDGYIKGDKDTEYNAQHKNAISSTNKIKGKGTNNGGHQYFSGYYGKPKVNPNEIDYSNFLTVSDSTQSIGGKIDIDKRNELALTRRYNYGNNEYSSKNQDALSDGNIIGKGTGLYLDTINGGGGYDVEGRAVHVARNEWRKDDIEYSRPLVLAEYDIQTEFKVSTTGELIEEKQKNAEAVADARLLKKTEKSKTVKSKNKRKDQQPDYIPGVPTKYQPGGATHEQKI